MFTVVNIGISIFMLCDLNLSYAVCSNIQIFLKTLRCYSRHDNNKNTSHVFIYKRIKLSDTLHKHVALIHRINFACDMHIQILPFCNHTKATWTVIVY